MAQVLAPRLGAAITELRERPISGTEKGFAVPAPGAVVSAASLGARRPSLFGPGFISCRPRIAARAGYPHQARRVSTCG